MNNLTIEQTYDHYIGELKKVLMFLKTEKAKKDPSEVFVIFNSNGTINVVTLNKKYAVKLVKGWNDVMEDRVHYEKFDLY